jgi:hypothetical protein
MLESAHQLADLAMMLSRASSAMTALSDVEEILLALENGDLSSEEALEEIQEVVSMQSTLEAMAYMSPEEMQAMLEESEESPEDEPPPPVKRLKKS